jgi:hypothetical protein
MRRQSRGCEDFIFCLSLSKTTASSAQHGGGSPRIRSFGSHTLCGNSLLKQRVLFICVSPGMGGRSFKEIR